MFIVIFSYFFFPITNKEIVWRITGITEWLVMAGIVVQHFAVGWDSYEKVLERTCSEFMALPLN